MGQQNRRNRQDAFEEHYEDMLGGRRVGRTDRADQLNRNNYADTSAFESRGHRRISRRLMRAMRLAQMIRRLVVTCVVLSIAAGALYAFFTYIKPTNEYKKALENFSKENYIAASAQFKTLGDYKDSEKYTEYIRAHFLEADGNRDEARAVFAALGDFLDSAERAAKIGGAQ